MKRLIFTSGVSLAHNELSLVNALRQLWQWLSLANSTGDRVHRNKLALARDNVNLGLTFGLIKNHNAHWVPDVAMPVDTTTS